MRRACLAALVLAVPLLGGFECNVTVDDGWDEGDTCTYSIDYPSFSECDNSSTLYFCNESDTVQAWSCADECAGGFCAYDEVLGYDWCLCPDDGWVVGGTCDYFSEYDDSICADDATLLACETDNFIYEVDCNTACGGAGTCGPDPTGLSWDICICSSWTPGQPCDYEVDYASSTCSGDTLTYCAVTDVIGSVSCYNQCQDWYGTNATGYCGIQDETGYNGCVCEIEGCDFAPYCNDSIWLVSCDGVNEVWTDCDATCVASGSVKGVCDAGSCVCD